MPGRIDPVTEAIVLALVEEAPRSGYDLRREVDGRFGGLVEISAGAIYYALKRLAAVGWLAGRRARRARRPERTAYRITALGRRALGRRLEELALQEDRFYSPFDIVLYLAPRVPRAVLRRAVRRRLEHVEQDLRRLARLEERFPGRWPFHFYYLREKTREKLDVEGRWCQRLMRKLDRTTPARR